MMAGSRTPGARGSASIASGHTVPPAPAHSGSSCCLVRPAQTVAAAHTPPLADLRDSVPQSSVRDSAACYTSCGCENRARRTAGTWAVRRPRLRLPWFQHGLDAPPPSPPSAILASAIARVCRAVEQGRPHGRAVVWTAVQLPCEAAVARRHGTVSFSSVLKPFRGCPRKRLVRVPCTALPAAR